jgi:hypothetical protein
MSYAGLFSVPDKKTEASSVSGDSDDVHPYRDFSEIVGRYWQAYGGLREVGRSPFLHAAMAATLLTAGNWWSGQWYTTAISVLPNLLGFGVTGYAIWIGWGDQEFRRALVDLPMRPGVSAYVQVSATFAHFTLVQVLALVWALLFAALDYVVDPSGGMAAALAKFGLPHTAFAALRPFGSCVGYLLFIYAILVALEATFALFRLATWLQRAPTKR